jgi:uncharacterized protein (DUF2461 family)
MQISGFAALLKGCIMADQVFKAFNPALVRFLEDLSQNNNREWFGKNKGRYETDVVLLHFLAEALEVDF